LRYLRLFPGAIAVAVLTLAISATTTALAASGHQVASKAGLTLDGLRTGHLWLVPASTLVQPELPLRWLMPFFVFAAIAFLEYQAGTLRALVTFFLSDWISSPLMILFLWGLDGAGWSGAEEYANHADTGASAATLGTFVAMSLLLRQPWRNLMLAGTAFYLAVQYSFLKLDVSIVHTLGAMVGLVAGLVWLRRNQVRQINTEEFWLTRLLTRGWRTVSRSS
jgi:hypothetical protein